MKLQDIKKQANSVYDEDDTDEYKNFTDKFKPKKKQQMIVLHPIMFMKRLRTMWRPDLMLTVIDLYVHFIRGGTIRVIHINPIALLLIIRHFQYWHR